MEDGNTTKPPASPGLPSVPPTTTSKKRKALSPAEEFIPLSCKVWENQKQVLPPPSKQSAPKNTQPFKKRRTEAGKVYRYGNYAHYYNYRIPSGQDPRVSVLSREWFQDRNCLDIGCNVGVVTLDIAQRYHCKQILGIDVDESLIVRAKEKLQKATQKESLRRTREAAVAASAEIKQADEGKTDDKDSEDKKAIDTVPKKKGKKKASKKKGREEDEEEEEEEEESEDAKEQKDKKKKKKHKKKKTKKEKGEKEKKKNKKKSKQKKKEKKGKDKTEKKKNETGGSEEEKEKEKEKGKEKGKEKEKEKDATQGRDEKETKPTNRFPFNVSFRHENFIDDKQPHPESYDVILCLSVAKWVHLNWGDEGIRTLFRKSHSLLKEGGVFILEPQNWKSYKRKARICEETKKNYQNIKFKPHEFKEWLLSKDGGKFSSCYMLFPPKATPGFKRTMYVFTK